MRYSVIDSRTCIRRRLVIQAILALNIPVFITTLILYFLMTRDHQINVALGFFRDSPPMYVWFVTWGIYTINGQELPFAYFRNYAMMTL